MENNNKSLNEVSRRQFLRGSAAATIGMMVLGPLAEIEAHASTASAQDVGLEHWLLKTGHGKLDPSLYQAVERHLA